MEYIPRTLENRITDYLAPAKAIILTGPRRTGKTVLLKKIQEMHKKECLFLNGDDFMVQDQLARRSSMNYEALLGDKRLLIVDEATEVPEIGKIIKLMLDSIPDLRIIISGSSSFDLVNKTGEPLTGRQYTFHLFPFTEQELASSFNLPELAELLRHRMIYGSYPELFSLPGNDRKSAYLRELANSYLLKDLLAFENLKNATKLKDLLRLLAFQIGNDVSIHELSRSLSMSRNTVERYLDLLTKIWVIFKVEPFSRNLRKEISKSARYYFLDNGIRNVLINNLESLEFRNDTGALWENLMVSERIKTQESRGMLVSNHFWRTYDKQEIDWIEERNGRLYGYEMKWSPTKQPRCPEGFSKTYPDATFMCVSRENYHDFINQ